MMGFWKRLHAGNAVEGNDGRVQLLMRMPLPNTSGGIDLNHACLLDVASNNNSADSSMASADHQASKLVFNGVLVRLLPKGLENTDSVVLLSVCCLCLCPDVRDC